MMSGFSRSWYLILPFLLIAPAPIQANLLTNPGFETASLDGWTRQLNDSAFYPAPAEFGTTPAGGAWMFGGTHSYDGADSLEIVTQTVTVVPGQTYRFAGQVLGQCEGGPDDHCRVRLTVDTDGGAVFEPDVYSLWHSGNWNTAEVYFTPSTASVTVGVELEQGFNHPWNRTFVDNLDLDVFTGTVPATPTPTPTPGHGIQKGLTAALGTGMTRIAAEEIADLGPLWIRYGFHHDGSGNIDYTVHDLAISRYKDYGMRIMGLVGLNTGPWNDSAIWPTASFRVEFASRTAELAAHYAGQVEAWEIWNEEDLVPVRIEPEPYGQLLAQTFDAVKAVDPDLLVISGGLSNALPVSASYLDALFNSAAFTSYYTQHGRYPLDAVAIHPYMWKLDPNDYLADQLNNNIRPVLASHGVPEMPIWLTEIGWNTDPTASNTMQSGVVECTNELLRATFITHLYEDARQIPYLGPVFYFALNGWGDQHFGLIQLDFTSGCPSWTAYRSVADPTPTPTPTPTATPSPTPIPASAYGYWLAR